MALFSFHGDSANNLKYRSSKTLTKKYHDKKKIPPEEQLFITLVRLRSGFGFKTIGHVLEVSKSDISIIFCTWIQFL
jgi:hypothetical protein